MIHLRIPKCCWKTRSEWGARMFTEIWRVLGVKSNIVLPAATWALVTRDAQWCKRPAPSISAIYLSTTDIQPLLERGALHWSTDSIPCHVIKEYFRLYLHNTRKKLILLYLLRGGGSQTFPRGRQVTSKLTESSTIPTKSWLKYRNMPFEFENLVLDIKIVLVPRANKSKKISEDSNLLKIIETIKIL